MLFGIVCATAVGLLPAAVTSDDGPRRAAEAVMNRVAAGDLAGAFDQMAARAKSPPEFAAAFGPVVKSLQEHRRLAGQTGEPAGVELIYRKDLGRSLTRLIYLERRDRSPVAWRLDFYRGDQEWHLLAWDIQSDVTKVFDAAK